MYLKKKKKKKACVLLSPGRVTAKCWLSVWALAPGGVGLDPSATIIRCSSLDLCFSSTEWQQD